MVLLLGANGYVGSKFKSHLDERCITWVTIPHKLVDYTQLDNLESILDSLKPSFVINCAGYTGKPNVDACEVKEAQPACIHLNIVYPMNLRLACERRQIEWLHVSSGCIYSGGKVDGAPVSDLRPFVNTPKAISGFTEDDIPNFSYTNPPCSFYSGSKALGEDALDGGNGYICRLRIPFNGDNDPRNYITKILKYDRFYDNVNSISHVDHFIDACIDLMESRAPFGIYNVVNTGFVTTREVLTLIDKYLTPDKKWKPWTEEEFLKNTKALRSNCVLDNTKLESVDIHMPTTQDALEMALEEYNI